MKYRVHLITLAIGTFLCSAGCSSSANAHGAEPEALPPNEVVDFNVLFRQNCAGCHGVDGKGGAAIALANPVFLAIADDNVIRRIASNGVPGTPMPALRRARAGCSPKNRSTRS